MKTMRAGWKWCKERAAFILVLAVVSVLAGCGRTKTMEPVAAESAATVSLQEAVEGISESESREAWDTEERRAEAPEAISGEYANRKLDPEGSYTTAEDVSLYLYTYEELPDNFLTKEEAKKLGWSGGSLEPYAPGMCIGGDHFGNYEGALPEGEYHECDIDTLGAKSRGEKRLVYSSDGRIYYTEDHYETFTLLYGESNTPPQ